MTNYRYVVSGEFKNIIPNCVLFVWKPNKHFFFFCIFQLYTCVQFYPMFVWPKLCGKFNNGLYQHFHTQLFRKYYCIMFACLLYFPRFNSIANCGKKMSFALTIVYFFLPFVFLDWFQSSATIIMINEMKFTCFSVPKDFIRNSLKITIMVLWIIIDIKHYLISNDNQIFDYVCM